MTPTTKTPPDVDTDAERSAWIEKNPLRKWRKSKGLSLMDTCATLECGISTVQAWEAGARIPTDEWFAKLASATNGATPAAGWKRWYNRRPKP